MTSGRESLLEQVSLGERPAGKRWSFGAGDFAETNLSVAVLEFFDDLLRKGAASGNFAKVFGHFAEDVGGSVSEE